LGLDERPPLPPGPYLVVGLARSGVAGALALAEEGAVVGCDAGRPAEALAERERLERAGVEVHLDTDGTQLLAGHPAPRTLVKSPGVPHDAPVVAEARRRGIEVMGELEIGWRMVPNRFVAVTGTNGKTTTTELLGAIYRTAGRPAAVAGNVGTPLTSLAGRIESGATVICEASSFQLEDSSEFAPEVALFLNFSEDHLDRHRSAEDYLAAKLRIFAHQDEADLAVVNASEPALAGVDLGRGRRVRFARSPRYDLGLDDHTIVWQGEPVVRTTELKVRGAHNIDNAMGAAAAALADGVEISAVAAALRAFEGLPHRMELVREIRNVAYVNDSKATNVAAAAAALRSFEVGVHLILGGSLKGVSFAPLVPVVQERCSGCYLIGEAADQLARDLRRSAVELVMCGDLERAVTEAARRARPGEAVLLAPACASFDQFVDYAERGERFRELVQALPG
jgi:UDP-N-acetylmuramoylalanine--D-glutamate ligase